tara:strand:+ start:2811 stop:3212 length:402 start_codon:yes stop_codon:yes gene_type:complete
VDQITVDYLNSNYKNKFQGARMCLEAYPGLREEAIKNITGIFDEDELAALIVSHQGSNLDGRELASRRNFEGFLADYWENNAETHITVNFKKFILKIRALGCMERFVLRELAYGIYTNPGVSEEILEKLLEKK